MTPRCDETDEDDDMAMPPIEDDAKLTGRAWMLRQAFRRAHEQLDVTIEMLEDPSDAEPAPSVPPQ
jgi:hypothetical protein